MNYSEETLREAAQRTANTYVKVANYRFKIKLALPVKIKFDLCERNPTWAGEAMLDTYIGLNMVLFRENVKEMLNQTIPHEVAHLVQHHMFTKRGVHVLSHGPEWKRIMQIFRKAPKKFHRMNLVNAKKHYREVKKAKELDQA